MCSKPKVPQQEKDAVLLTSQDTKPSGHAADRRRKSAVRLDLNARPFQGLTIPSG